MRFAGGRGAPVDFQVPFFQDRFDFVFTQDFLEVSGDEIVFFFWGKLGVGGLDHFYLMKNIWFAKG